MSHRTVSDLGEHALITRITARLAMPSWVVVGPGDDAAVIEPERGALDVLTTDAQVEGIHFDRRFVPPDAIGHRALAVNLSDLAAMGATPRAALLSFVLPDALDVAIVDGIVDGIVALAAKYRVGVVGGNITRSPGPLMIDVTATGFVKERGLLRRAGARPGDEIYVTGSVGGATAGLELLRRGASLSGSPDEPEGFARLTTKFLRPEPRVRAGVLLGRNRAATSCMDLSDGLADGLRQMAAASGVGMTVDEDAIPVTDGLAEYCRAQGTDPACDAPAGGEDYELLFTVRPAFRGRLRAVRGMVGDLPITRIGVVTKDTRVILRSKSGDRDLPQGFEHFR